MNRGALNLLASYGSDSSDDDVPACKVSVKRTFKQTQEDEYANAKRKLPVPSIIASSALRDSEFVDDASLHEGRVRTFAHERGNWATYVYVPYEASPGVDALIQRLSSSLPQGELKPVDHFHISVTRTVILRHHWIDSFVQSVRENLSCIKSFMILFGPLKVYCNEERTRTFIGLQVKSGYDSLIHMVKCLDSCLAEFKLPEFYKDPSFHVSIVWCTGDYEEELKALLSETSSEIAELTNSYPQDSWYFIVNTAECKTGNKLFTFNLI